MYIDGYMIINQQLEELVGRNPAPPNAGFRTGHSLADPLARAPATLSLDCRNTGALQMAPARFITDVRMHYFSRLCALRWYYILNRPVENTLYSFHTFRPQIVKLVRLLKS